MDIIKVPIEQILDCDSFISSCFRKAANGEDFPQRKNCCGVKFSLSCNSYNDDETIQNGINERIQNADASFSGCLRNYISEKKLSAATVYKGAMLDKSTFSKIINNVDYSVSRDTAICICFALELTISEANDLLSHAGYLLSNAIMRDIILGYCLSNHINDIVRVNALLDHYSQRPLGRDK